MKKESDKFAPSTQFEGIVSLRSVINGIETGVSDRKIVKLYYAKENEKSKHKELSWLKFLSDKYHFPILMTSMSEIDVMSVGNTHGGILFSCTERILPPLTEEKIVPGGFYVLTDGIEDPYNFGYSVRSLYAAGVNGLILPPRNWMNAAGVVCRASAGASEVLPMAVSEVTDAVDQFHRAGYKIICADMENSVSMYNAELTKPLLLVVGGEKRGISQAILSRADSVVRIEYGREFSQALSAASAATVLGFEVYRQNRNG